MRTLFFSCMGLALGWICSLLLQRCFPLPADNPGQQSSRTAAALIYGLPLISAGLFLLLAGQLIEPAELIILLTGVILALYDLDSQTYPLLIWLIGFVTACWLAGPNWLTLALLMLAGLAQLGYIPIGAGDFLYLAAISLIFSFQQLLWLIQLASLTGLLAFLKLKKEGGSLPFIPFISLALVFLLTLEKLALLNLP